MFKIIKRKISIKLVLIIMGVVTIASMILFIYLNRVNTERMTKALDYTIESTSGLLETAYEDPLWNYSKNGVANFSKDVLKIPEVVAVNVYDREGFFLGYQKKYTDSGFIEDEISKPFNIPANKNYLHKKFVKVHNNIDVIGSFELFYTVEFIIESNKNSRIRMGICFVILAFVIIFISHLVIKIIVIGPVTNLSANTQKIAESKDYSLTIERSGTDEIATLYAGFNDMLQQIRQKESQREEIFSSLKKSDDNYNYMFNKLQDAVNSGDYSKVETDETESGHELIKSLNKFLETLKSYDIEAKEIDFLKTGQTTLNNAISGEMALNELCRKAITHIAEYINIQVAAVYVKNSDHNNFNLCAGYAFTKEEESLQTFKPGEGLAGQAVLGKKRILVTSVPDNHIRVTSILGDSIPKNILLLPLIYEEEVIGVVELGSILKFTQIMIEFAELSCNIVAVAVNVALANKKLNKLLEYTSKQSEELQSQQKILQRNNIELQKHAEILKKSESRLQVQKEELQASNEEMEEKNKLLESRKNEIEQKDVDLEKTRTEIEEKATQLELATRYKAEFFANMSHELRTPLNSMLLLARMLAENEENNLSEDQIESAASINKSGLGLLRLINDILDLSKIEAKKIELNITSVNIHDLLSDIKREFQHLAMEKKFKFSVAVEEGLPEIITTDVLRLEQIVRNLIGNAFKFTKEGSVSVKIYKPKKDIQFNKKELQWVNTIAISVTDTGIGIHKSKMKLIFEAFRQVDGSISRQHGGTGLGLSISRELVSLIGGELTVESTLGKGTVFTIYIPEILLKTFTNDKISDLLVKNEAAKLQRKMTIVHNEISDKNTLIKNKIGKSAPNNAEPNQAKTNKTVSKNTVSSSRVITAKSIFDDIESNKVPNKDTVDKDIVQKSFINKNITDENVMDKKDSTLPGKKVMLADTDMRNAFTVKKFLTAQKMEVSIVNNGTKVLELLQDKKPDIILISSKLPGIDGYEVMKKIRKDSSCKDIPILAFTSDTVELDSEECMKCGANDYLSKPVDTAKLLSMLKVWLYG